MIPPRCGACSAYSRLAQRIEPHRHHPAGHGSFSRRRQPRPAREFQAKAELGGVAGVVAPLVGKQPKDWKFLILQGQAPAFVREEGQFYEDGPVWRVDQIGPVTR